jgi:hypothetical protein
MRPISIAVSWSCALSSSPALQVVAMSVTGRVGSALGTLVEGNPPWTMATARLR